MKEVIDAVKTEEKSDVVTLSTGYRAIIKPVSARLMQAVMAKFPEPQVPIVYNEERGRKEEDPFNDEYRARLSEIIQQKAAASLDTMAMFGIELVDPIPDDSTWLAKLRLFDQLGLLDLTEYDLEDETTKEFLFKRYIALGNADLVKISMLSGIRSADIKAAEETFQGSTGRGTD